jgi:hypothetical protein
MTRDEAIKILDQTSLGKSDEMVYYKCEGEPVELLNLNFPFSSVQGARIKRPNGKIQWVLLKDLEVRQTEVK